MPQYGYRQYSNLRMDSKTINSNQTTHIVLSKSITERHYDLHPESIILIRKKRLSPLHNPFSLYFCHAKPRENGLTRESAFFALFLDSESGQFA